MTDISKQSDVSATSGSQPLKEEPSMIDWISDNPGTMITYMVLCLGAGSMIGGIYLGNRVRIANCNYFIDF